MSVAACKNKLRSNFKSKDYTSSHIRISYSKISRMLLIYHEKLTTIGVFSEKITNILVTIFVDKSCAVAAGK